MGLSINPRVMAALSGVGLPVFFHAWRKCEAYPRPPDSFITFQEMLYQSELRAGDEDFLMGRYVLVDIWSSGDTEQPAQLVRAGMRAAGFILRGEQDIFEADTGTYHRATEWVLYEQEEE